MWRKISLYGIPLGVALVAACGGSTNSSGDGGSGGSSSGGGDAGVMCGFQACSSSEVCCFNTGQGTCVAAGSCKTSAVLTCSSTSMCPSGQSCCFAYTGDSGSEFETSCQDSCGSGTYQLCATSAECPNGDSCTQGPYARYCAVPFDGNFAFPEGGFPFFEGGFPFPRRDASMQAPGDDGAAPTGDDGSTPIDAPSE